MSVSIGDLIKVYKVFVFVIKGALGLVVPIITEDLCIVEGGE